MSVRTIAFSILGLVAVSCTRSVAPRFYYLSPAAIERAAGEGPAVGIETVTVPAYVDRESLVTVQGPHELRLYEGLLWAEPLEAGVTRVLAENLAALLGTDRVEVGVWPADAVEYRVTVRISRMVGGPGVEAELDARWQIDRLADDAPPVEGRSRLRRPAGPDTASYVASLSDLLEELSREIALAFPGRGL